MKHKEEILDLGNIYVSEFVSDIQNAHVGLKFPLTLIWDDKLQCPVLSEQPPHDMMWGKYWYRSGINPKMALDLRDVVHSINEIVDLPKEREHIWLDIASNDGTLLSNVHKNYFKLGVDPCKGDIYEKCKENAHMVIQDYFSEEVITKQELWNKPKVITCCAMFYDLKDPLSFLADVESVMHDEGVFVMQYTYTPKMIEMGDFMNICHEHYAYHYFENVYDMMKVSGLHTFKVELNDVNGGSIRIYADKGIRKVGDSVMDLLSQERKIDKEDQWKVFVKRMHLNKFKIVNLLDKISRAEKECWGYGASTKGNTLLQYYNLDSDDIIKIAEANKQKYGKYTKGSGIEICSEDEWRKANPEYTLILPFHFVDFFVQKEKAYLENGGKFIVPCPSPYIIDKDGIREI